MYFFFYLFYFLLFKIFFLTWIGVGHGGGDDVDGGLGGDGAGRVGSRPGGGS